MRQWPPACKTAATWHVGGVTVPLLIGSEIYRGSTYGPKHPLAIPRVSTTLDLIRAMGWVAPGQYLDSPRARPEQLTRFHTPDYVAALMRAEAEQVVSPEARARHHIGAARQPRLSRGLLPPRHRRRRHHAGRGADARGRRRACAGRRHASRPARPRRRLLLPERRGAGAAGLARPGAAAASSTSTSTRITATASSSPSTTIRGSSPVRPRGRALAAYRPAETAPAAMPATCRCRRASTTARWTGCCATPSCR